MQASSEYGFRNFLAAIRRRRALLLGVGGAIFVLCAALAFLLPSIYRSSAIILIEQQEIPSDLVRSTVTSYADQRIQTISQRVMTTANLKGIIEKYGLYEEKREREPMESVVEDMREDIDRQMISAEVVDPRSGRPTEATIAFSLSFDHRNPALAQKVTSELVSLYLNENIKTRTEAAKETTTFLGEEATKLREKIGELEKALADFKTENADSRPELERVIRENLNRTELDLADVERRINADEQQRLYFESELEQISPRAQVSAGGVMSPEERLRTLESQLLSAEAAYGDKHPDVRQLRKQVEALRAEADPVAARKQYQEELDAARAEAQKLTERYGPEYPDLVRLKRRIEGLESRIASVPAGGEERNPDNPAYLSAQARLAALDTELNTLRKTREELRAKVNELTTSLYKIPDVEARYRALTRDYDAAYSRYQELTAKQMEARMSQSLESERKGEKFTLIEPPLVPVEPAKPNRIAILSLGILFSMVSGFGAVGLAESMDTRIHGRVALQQLLSAPPLASIPVIGDATENTRARRRTLVLLATLIVLALLILVTVHFAYKPLDVLWYIVLRKLGI